MLAVPVPSWMRQVKLLFYPYIASDDSAQTLAAALNSPMLQSTYVVPGVVATDGVCVGLGDEGRMISK